MHDSLGATSGQFSLSISIFILLQGVMPLVWTSISEIKGRKVSRTKLRLDLVIACSVGGIFGLVDLIHSVIHGRSVEP
jgi:MFS family permease